MPSLASELQQLISVLHATPAAYHWSELTTAASTLFSVCVAFVKDTTTAHYHTAPPPTARSHPPHGQPIPQQRFDSQWLPDQCYPPLERPKDLWQQQWDDILHRAYATALSKRKDIAHALSALRTSTEAHELATPGAICAPHGTFFDPRTPLPRSCAKQPLPPLWRTALLRSPLL